MLEQAAARFRVCFRRIHQGKKLAVSRFKNCVGGSKRPHEDLFLLIQIKVRQRSLVFDCHADFENLSSEGWTAIFIVPSTLCCRLMIAPITWF